MTIKQRIENILRASQKARNDDKELMIIYLQKSGMELTDRQIAKLKDLPSFETLRRIRQKLQEEGKYPATKEVDDARYEKFKQVRQNIARSDSGDVERIIAGDVEYIVKPYGAG